MFSFFKRVFFLSFYSIYEKKMFALSNQISHGVVLNVVIVSSDVVCDGVLIPLI